MAAQLHLTEILVFSKGILDKDDTSFVGSLKVCTKQKDLCKGGILHARILKSGLLEKDIYICNTLLHMYAKCGALAKAQEVFGGLPIRSVASWNALIAGYTAQGLHAEAVHHFDQMQDEGFHPDAVTFTCILKACSSIGAADKGAEIHAEVVRLGLLPNDTVLGTALLDTYAKSGVLAKAQGVFDELLLRNVVSWNTLISGYAQHGYGDAAVDLFDQMREEGVSPSSVTYACTLKACVAAGSLKKGEEIHAEIANQQLEEDMVLGTALVDLYAKCGALAKAQRMFDKLVSHDTVSWSALITGYAQHGHNLESLNCLRKMQEQGLSPSAVTYLSILKACGSIGAAEMGKQIHLEICRHDFLKDNIMLSTALVDMYAKCGMLEEAQEVFDKLPMKDVVTWNALIAGYVYHGHGIEAVNCFEWMRDDGFSADAVTFISILKACGSIGAVEKGGRVHAEISKLGLLKTDVVFGNAVVDMYVKCGELENAQEVFNELPIQDTVSWNALITGYAQIGLVGAVFNSFNKMITRCGKLDLVRFSVLLTACSHAGLVDEELVYIETMSAVYGIIPDCEHYTCLIDLYSRAGHFDKVIHITEQLGPINCLPLWAALLGACRKWRNVEVGKWAFKHLMQLDEKYTAAYICICDIFVAAGMGKEAAKIEAMRKDNGCIEDVRVMQMD